MARTTEASSDNAPAGVLSPKRSRTSRRHPAVLSAWLMGARWRHASRWLGLAIFLSGAVLLYYVFMEAWHGFQRFQESDYLAESFKNVPAANVPANVRAIIVLFSAELLRVLYLLLLGFVASAIAARGIQFFSASEAVIDEAVVPDMTEDEEETV